MTGLPKVTELLHQEVSRKEFLRYSGIAILSLVGVTSMMRNLQVASNQTQKKQSAGYGVSAYGR